MWWLLTRFITKNQAQIYTLLCLSVPCLGYQCFYCADGVRPGPALGVNDACGALGLFELCFNLVADVDVALLAYKLVGLWAVGKYGHGDRGVVVGEEVSHHGAGVEVAIDESQAAGFVVGSYYHEGLAVAVGKTQCFCYSFIETQSLEHAAREIL